MTLHITECCKPGSYSISVLNTLAETKERQQSSQRVSQSRKATKLERMRKMHNAKRCDCNNRRRSEDKEQSTVNVLSAFQKAFARAIRSVEQPTQDMARLTTRQDDIRP
jgi:hypothetical protein